MRGGYNFIQTNMVVMLSSHQPTAWMFYLYSFITFNDKVVLRSDYMQTEQKAKKEDFTTAKFQKHGDKMVHC